MMGSFSSKKSQHCILPQPNRRDRLAIDRIARIGRVRGASVSAIVSNVSTVSPALEGGQPNAEEEYNEQPYREAARGHQTRECRRRNNW